MTPTQAHAEAFIIKFCDTHSHGPSIREIQEGAGINGRKTTVQAIAALERAGRISRKPYTARSITPIPKHDQFYAQGYERATADLIEAEMAGFTVRLQGARYYLYRINGGKAIAGPFDSAEDALNQTWRDFE